MPEEYVPERGDVVWLTLDPQLGQAKLGRLDRSRAAQPVYLYRNQQPGDRPVLVLSPHAFNQRTTLAFCCPITSRVRNHPFEVPLPFGLEVSGVVLTEQLKSLAWQQHHARFMARVPEAVLQAVTDRLAAILGFEAEP